MTASSAAISETRQIGEATITVIADGEMLWEPRFPVPEAEWRAALPEADEQGRIWIGLNVVLVRLGDALVVIDPGCDAPDSAWQSTLPRIWPNWPIRRTAGLDAALTELGVDPNEVTHVVITHPHGDHYPGVCREAGDDLIARFPHARHFMGRADWEGNPNRNDPASHIQRLAVIDNSGRLHLIDSDTEIAPGVTVLPAPGESPGHVVVRIDTGATPVYILGDLVHHGVEVAHPTWNPPHADHEPLLASRERLYPLLADEGAHALYAHEPFPSWGRIVRDGDGYRWVRG
jgi:glyoxylase-like metal-dependent hydrolase (beta-lactamase superfamily II)